MISGNRIKEIRNKLGLTQEAFGKLIGVSKVAICGYETGGRTPRLSKLRELSDKLNVSVSYLMGNDQDVVMENNTYGKVTISKEEANIIKELRKHKKLYNNLIDNPVRTTVMLSKVSKFEK